MALNPDQEIRELRSVFWSDRDPDGRAFVSLADAYRRGGDHAQALELLEDGLDRHPDFASAHVVAAWLHRDRDESDAAEAAFRMALELDGENGEALLGLGEMAAARGDRDGALEWLGRLAALEPSNEAVAVRMREIEGGAVAAPAGAGDDGLDVGALDVGFGPATADAAPDPADDQADDSDPWGAFDEPEPAVEAGGSGDELLPDPDELFAVEAFEAPADEAATGDDPLAPSPDALELTDAGDPVEEDEEEEGVPGAFDVPAAAFAVDEVVDADAADAVEDEVRVDEAEPEPWGQPPHEPDEGDVTPAGGLYTRTMAELYARQGLDARALDVFERLAERSPGDPELRARVDELRGRLAASAGEADEAVEAQARDLAERADAPADVASPFAWSAGEDDEAEPEEDAGPPVRAYFDSLLAWAPAPRPADPDLPEADTAAAVAERDAVVEEDAAGTDDAAVIDIADLAPAPDSGEPVVDIGELAPAAEADDPVVEIGALAPSPVADEPVVDIADLAPEGGSDGGEDEPPPAGSDDFARWLNQLR